MSKLSAALRRVKTRFAALCLGFFLLGPPCGCGTIVARDRAPSRPDTVVPANLLGPYEGRVVEQGSGQPVADALVIGSFGYSRGAGLRAAAGASVVESTTDDDGRYRIVAPEELPTGPSVRLDRFTLIVYRRGFVAYRSDRVLDGTAVLPRLDFSQLGNEIVLRKLDPTVGHRRHLEFLGVWGAPKRLADAIAWEFAEAARADEPEAEAGPAMDVVDSEPQPAPTDEAPEAPLEAEPPVVPADDEAEEAEEP